MQLHQIHGSQNVYNLCLRMNTLPPSSSSSNAMKFMIRNVNLFNKTILLNEMKEWKSILKRFKCIWTNRKHNYIEKANKKVICFVEMKSKARECNAYASACLSSYACHSFSLNMHRRPPTNLPTNETDWTVHGSVSSTNDNSSSNYFIIAFTQFHFFSAQIPFNGIVDRE